MNMIRSFFVVGLAMLAVSGMMGCKSVLSARETRIHAHRRSAKTPTTIRQHKLPPPEKHERDTRR
ncbi:MAG: hypothetical protein MJ240_06615 [Kiritimatiellae bacterium]|nr:hypothetical protein [Kiritimatiellia bacterium]